MDTLGANLVSIIIADAVRGWAQNIRKNSQDQANASTVAQKVKTLNIGIVKIYYGLRNMATMVHFEALGMGAEEKTLTNSVDAIYFVYLQPKQDRFLAHVRHVPGESEKTWDIWQIVISHLATRLS